LTRVTWYVFFTFNWVVFLANAQPSGLSVYQFPKQIPLSYQFNLETELAKMPFSEPSELKKNDFEYFTHTIIENRIHQINQGEIYLDWIEAELYVKRLLNRLLPDSLKNKKAINIYIRRDAVANAYSSFDASIYINMGLLADIKSEAALAFVLSHELAHYIGQHQLHNYKLFKQNQKKEEKKLKKLVHTNKLLELEADKIAAQIIQQAGFNVQEAYSVFDLIYSSENLFKKERIENIKQAIPQTEHIKDLDDSPMFKKITQFARYEKVQVLLNQFEYNLCLKNALQYYVNDSTTLQFLPYYIVEAIRRHLLLHPEDLEKAVFDSYNQQAYNIAGSKYIEKGTLNNTYKDLLNHFLMPEFIEHVPDLLFSKALYAYQLNKHDAAADFFNEYIKLKTSKQYNGLAKYLSKGFQKPKKAFNKSIAIIESIGAYNLKDLNKPVLDVSKSLLLNKKYNSKLKKNLSAKFPKQSIKLQRDLCQIDYRKTNMYRQLSIAALLAQNIKQAIHLPVHEILFLLQPTAFTLLEEEQIDEIAIFKVNTFNKYKNQKLSGAINPLSWIGKAFFGSEKHFMKILLKINILLVLFLLFCSELAMAQSKGFIGSKNAISFDVSGLLQQEIKLQYNVHIRKHHVLIINLSRQNINDDVLYNLEGNSLKVNLAHDDNSIGVGFIMNSKRLKG